MGSRKEEERNEKIIRGLMKLPPNRKCMNCNSLGPQYVCTNFWTFVCVTCSGIHREFTHRVKSVSMAKFTSQEVEALQKGGNQNLRHHEDETRRASSYHSYSQSPPYDYQYEERRYGKQAHALTRKPGSDRGLYEGRLSSFFSPSRFSDQMHEDSFANEGSNPRASDYSVSSAGDPFRSDAQSPNFQRDIGMRSPPQRTASLGSTGSFNSNSISLKSVNSGSLADVSSEPAESAGTHQDKQYAVPSLPQSSVSGNFGGLDLFNAPFVAQAVNSAIDWFQSPEMASTPPVDLFQPSSNSSVLSLHAHQPSQTIPPSLNTFDMPPHQPDVTLDQKYQEEVIPKNERWATFDLPQFVAPNLGVDDSIPAVVPPTGGGALGKFDSLLSSSATLQWPVFDDGNAHGPSSMPNLWHEGLNNVQVSDNAMSAQSWNAFEDPTGNLSLWNNQQSTEEVAVNAPFSTTVNQHLSGIYGDGIQRAALDSGPPIPSVPLHVNGSSYAPPSIPSTVGAQSHATDCKSTNPFDLPYESDLESSSLFMDMSSLQAALPSGQIPNSYLDGVTQPWFPQNTVKPSVPAQQGALGFMGGQAPNTHMP
ncbi:ARF GAP-like zinc finger-containing protein ZIGA4 [Actinidia rufa]|uniref:ARF GAP-like zinc finger-containing protein ZIGA4 n=1 Tax=Actinidia rufa TaxID=165716 RepID=A0A7J0GEY7_9ERIC|nr:ARF GAP-like zinc finger-containing protein ZIGA4 [Actinidia rufa]